MGNNRPFSSAKTKQAGKILLVTVFLCSLSVFLNAQENQKILVLNSYHQGLPWGDGMTEGVMSLIPREAELYVEYMDTKRFPFMTVIGPFEKLLSQKYRDIDFDVIISCDDNAFRFLQLRHKTLFPGVPVAFCGINDHLSAVTADPEIYTGVLEKTDIEETLRTAMELLPATETVLVITGNTVSAKTLLERIIGISRRFPGVKFEFLNRTGGLTLDKIRNRLDDAGANTIVYFSDFYLDGNGEYLDYHDYLPELTEQYDVPFFVHAEFYLGYGPVGGKLNSSYYQGRTAAEIALSILDGKKPRDLPLQNKSPNRYMFDYRRIKRFGIPLERLPPKSVIVNKEENILVKYRGPILITAALVSGLIIFTSVLLINVLGWRRTRRALSDEQYLFHFLLNNIPDYIYFKDMEGRYIMINKSLASAMGLIDPAEAAGKTDEDYFGSEYFAQSHGDEKTILETEQPVIGREESLIMLDNSLRWQSSTKLPYRNRKGEIIGTFGISRDITEMKKYEKEITASLQEKQVLLKEIHHRVKNNLSMVSGLINLQFNTPGKKSMDEIFLDLSGRIRSIALVHEQLYKSSNLSSININEYVTDLVSFLHPMLQNAKISEFLDIQDVELSVNEAIPLGLIINELLTNTYKYAFPAHQQEKKVIIRFLKKQTDFILRVSDNGTGFPDHFNPDDSGSLGYQIINGLVQQLKGTITIEKDSAAVTVIFPEKTMNKPVSSGY